MRRPDRPPTGNAGSGHALSHGEAGHATEPLWPDAVGLGPFGLRSLPPYHEVHDQRPADNVSHVGVATGHFPTSSAISVFILRARNNPTSRHQGNGGTQMNPTSAVASQADEIHPRKTVDRDSSPIFAAGAMLYVVGHEIIPQTHRHGVAMQATLRLAIGLRATAFRGA